MAWLAAGKAFVPIGLDLPEARQQYIIRDTGMQLCLDDEKYKKELRYGVLSDYPTRNAKTPAYIIYSSGTTGTPKGIVVGHSGLWNLARCQSEAFRVNDSSTIIAPNELT